MERPIHQCRNVCIMHGRNTTVQPLLMLSAQIRALGLQFVELPSVALATNTEPTLGTASKQMGFRLRRPRRHQALCLSQRFFFGFRLLQGNLLLQLPELLLFPPALGRCCSFKAPGPHDTLQLLGSALGARQCPTLQASFESCSLRTHHPLKQEIVVPSQKTDSLTGFGVLATQLGRCCGSNSAKMRFVPGFLRGLALFDSPRRPGNNHLLPPA
mmetsp:Transcript_4027/g.9711  ORF Transcript_4027/g.9711 Transcript_4027/m.9711 type:complete len:214 (-) Transcript_4027:83-724(-)